MISLSQPSAKINAEDLLGQVEGIVDFLNQGFANGAEAHEVEEGLWKRILDLGRYSFGAWLDLFGSGDAGACIPGEGGRSLKRLEHRHRREYQSVFGPFELQRTVYGTREGQAIEAVPLDARLNLPQGKTSYLLQDWEQSLTVEVPFATVSATLDRILGLSRSVHTLERDQRAMAQSVSAFWDEQAMPAPEEEGALLVCTADGKGVPMRREQAAETPPEAVAGQRPQASAGPRPGTKKMALLGAAYTIDPVIRTPDEVLDSLFADISHTQPDTTRPQPCHKQVRAALERDTEQTTAPQVASIFGWLREQARARNPDGDKPIVLIMDGQASLWDAGWEALPQRDEEVTEVLDLLHALGYLWEAASLFYPSAPTGPEAVVFVKRQAERLLNGQIETVLHALRWLGTHHALRGKRLDQLERIRGYFANNAHRMAYDTYLAHGFPIASGVIEGACRCVVKDRMERSGMRWVMAGAQAMLHMRCIALSDLWESFRTFRIQRESQRLYPGYAANDADFNQVLAA